MRLHQHTQGTRLAAPTLPSASCPARLPLRARPLSLSRGLLKGLSLTGLSLLGLAACGDSMGGDTLAISQTRVATRPSQTAISGLDMMERTYGPEVVAAERARARGGAERPANPLLYEVPEGWEELPRAQFRDINLRFLADPSAEMVLTFLQEDGGGLVPNIDRWRGQVGMEPMTQTETAALTTRTVFGRDATYVELFGPYQGMRGPKIEDGGIFGAIFSQGGGTLFVKMTGTRAVLEAEREHFHAFLDSLEVNRDMGATGAAANGQSAGGRTSPLAWDSISGWTEVPSTSQFREVTFRKNGIEMYVSTARGNALDNITRWAGQIGQPALDEDALGKLERVEMMGRQGYIYAAEGTLQAMGAPAGKPGQGMLAALVEGAGQIVTVKLTGPAEAVADARPDFLTLVTSLRARQPR